MTRTKHDPRETASAWRVLSAMALAGILVTGCGSDPRPNVILVSVDTLRADALKPYGGPIPTPALQRLAEEGVLFERALAPAPSTGPSHASLLTGLEVLHHRVVSNGQELPANLETLAEVFSREGYETAAFVSSFVLDRRFGWNRGFDRFDDELPEEHATARADPAHPGRLFQDQERGPAIVDLLIDSAHLALGVYAADRLSADAQTRPSGWDSGLELGAGFELPLLPRIDGPFVGFRGALRWSLDRRWAAVTGADADGALMLTLGVHHLLTTGLLDDGD